MPIAKDYLLNLLSNSNLFLNLNVLLFLILIFLAVSVCCGSVWGFAFSLLSLLSSTAKQKIPLAPNFCVLYKCVWQHFMHPYPTHTHTHTHTHTRTHIHTHPHTHTHTHTHTHARTRTHTPNRVVFCSLYPPHTKSLHSSFVSLVKW